MAQILWCLPQGVCSSDAADKHSTTELDAEEWTRLGHRFLGGGMPEEGEPKCTAAECFQNALLLDVGYKEAWKGLREAGGGRVKNSDTALPVEYSPEACQAKYDEILAEEERKAKHN